MRFTALPSPWTGAPALRVAGNWLRRHYLHVTVATLILLILNEFYLFGADPPAWDWLLVSGWITFMLTCKAAFLLPDKVDDALKRLAASRVLDDSDHKLGDFKQGLHESAGRAARAGGVIVAGVLALGWVAAKRGALPYYLLTVLLEMAGAFLAGSFIGRTVSYSRLGQRLKDEKFSINVDPEHLDDVAGLGPIGRLYFFQSALVAVPGAFLAVWWFLIPLFGERYNGWRDVYAGLLVFVVACEALAFFSPMWSFHRIMREEKARLLIEADQISDKATGIQKQLRDTTGEEVTAQLEDQLGRMTKRYQAIVEMPTWPVDKRIRRRFAVNNLILFLAMLTQLLGTPGSWQHFLEDLQKALSGQG